MAINFTPGQVISWDDLNAMLAQHGSPQGAKSIREIKPKPLTKEERNQIEDAGGDPDAARPTAYQYFMEDGSSFTAELDQPGEQTGDGVAGSGRGSTFRIVEYKPSATYTQTQTPAAQSRERPTTRRIEGTPIPGQPGQFDNSQPIIVNRDANGQQVGATEALTADERKRWEQEKNQSAGRGFKTDAELANPADQVGKPTGNTRQSAKNGTTVKETEYQLPDGSTVWRSQTETDQPDLVGKPTGATRSGTKDGKTVKEVEYVLPNGTKEWRSQEAEVAQPVSSETKTPVKDYPGWTEVKSGKKDAQGNETGEVYYLDPQGQRQNSLPDKKNIKGVPPYTPDLTKPGAGLIDRAKELDGLVQAGTITWDQRNQVLEQDHVLASSITNEFNVGVGLLREDYQNQASQRNVDVTNAQSRATLANSHVRNALDVVMKFAPYLGVKQGAAGRMFTSMLAGQLALATSYGGMKDYPREQMNPGVKAWAERAVGGATTPSVPGATPTPGMPAPVPSATPAVAPAPGQAAIPQHLFDVSNLPTVPATNTTDAGGAPREFTPASATNDPTMQGPQANPRIAALFGPGMGAPRPPEEDSWRQQALNRQAVAMGQNMVGAGLPPLPEALGTGDLNADFQQPISPILNTNIPGLTPEMDQLARQQLETDWLS